MGLCRSCWLDGLAGQSDGYLGSIGGDKASNRQLDTHPGSFQRYDALRSQYPLCWKRGCMLVEEMVLQQGQLMLGTSSIGPRGEDRICCIYSYLSSLGEGVDVRREEDESWGAERGASAIKSIPACTNTAVPSTDNCLPAILICTVETPMVLMGTFHCLLVSLYYTSQHLLLYLLFK